MAKKNIVEIFAANLRRLREEKGLSLRQLSATCNVEHSDISRMENGKVNVTLKTVEHLAEALDVSITDLLTE